MKYIFKVFQQVEELQHSIEYIEIEDSDKENAKINSLIEYYFRHRSQGISNALSEYIENENVFVLPIEFNDGTSEQIVTISEHKEATLSLSIDNKEYQINGHLVKYNNKLYFAINRVIKYSFN